MKTNQNSKYLFLVEPEEEFPEQLNSYVFLVMEMLLLAKKTNRIFVLPFLHSHPRNNAIAEKGETDHRKFVLGKLIFPMEKIFNRSEINEYVPTISHNEFLEISRNRLSTLFCFRNPHYNISESYGLKIYCEKIINTKDIGDVINSKDKYIGITGYTRGKYLIPSSPNWPKNLEKDYWEIRKHLRYCHYLDVKAKEFIAKHKLERFLSVHWRRGDRVHPEMTTMSEIIEEDKYKMKRLLDEYLIEPIQDIITKRKLNKVFLATNSGTKWHLDYLKSRLPIIQLKSSGSWKKREEESILEQIICSWADYFFAAPFDYQHCSSFSRWIIDFKIIEGEGDSVSYQKKMGSKIDPTPNKNRVSQIRNQILSIVIPSAKRLLRSMKKIFELKPLLFREKIIEGLLFKDHLIKLDSRSVQVGGSWMQPNRRNKPITNDPKIIELFNKNIVKNKNSVLYDIGASTGSFSMLSRFNPKLSVYAFEPQPNVYNILNQNVQINNLSSRITTFQIAFSDKESVLPLQVPKKLSQSGLATLGAPLRFTQAESVSVAASTLDSFSKQFNLPDPTHIKIDTEGAELLVLKGGEKLIRRTKPVLLLECDEKNTVQFGYHATEIIKLLEKWGYNVNQLDREDILCLPK